MFSALTKISEGNWYVTLTSIMEDGDANYINTELVQRFLDTSFVHGTYIFNASPSGGGWSYGVSGENSLL